MDNVLVNVVCCIAVAIVVGFYIASVLPTLCFYFKFRRYMKKNEPELYDQIMKE